MVKVLFVCLGNICRSPLAEGMFRHKLGALGTAAVEIEVDSAGTSDWHIGDPPDKRAQEAARRRGMDLSKQRARQLSRRDFQHFDHILVMDRNNLAAVEAVCPPEHRAKVRLFLDFAPHLGVDEVPDPYWGGADHFDAVLDMVEAAADGLVAQILNEFDL